MIIVVGLGNPGRQYANTRHNIGFMILDKLCEMKQLQFKRTLTLHARFAVVPDEKRDTVLLVKPLTFMNNSGRVVKGFCKKYDIGLDKMLIIYDDADLEIGKIKFKKEGSSAGHKGMESIIQALGTDCINRLRVGIGRPFDAAQDLTEYVLTEFTNQEKKMVEDVVSKAALLCLDWISYPQALHWA